MFESEKATSPEQIANRDFNAELLEIKRILYEFCVNTRTYLHRSFQYIQEDQKRAKELNEFLDSMAKENREKLEEENSNGISVYDRILTEVKEDFQKKYPASTLPPFLEQ